MATKGLPDWIYRSATAGDRKAAQQAYNDGKMLTNWSAANDLKGWAKRQGWPTPWLNFETRFYETMFASEANFLLAVTRSGLQIRIPIEEHTITAADLERFDSEYADPQQWRWLVEALREVRRVIEAGVVVRVEDKVLSDFESFYTWAHGRYHRLEDGADEWIGVD